LRCGLSECRDGTDTNKNPFVNAQKQTDPPKELVIIDEDETEDDEDGGAAAAKVSSTREHPQVVASLLSHTDATHGRATESLPMASRLGLLNLALSLQAGAKDEQASTRAQNARKKQVGP
jgi:hypothetical protein